MDLLDIQHNDLQNSMSYRDEIQVENVETVKCNEKNRAVDTSYISTRQRLNSLKIHVDGGKVYFEQLKMKR